MKRKFGSVWVLLLVMGLMVMTGGCGGGGGGETTPVTREAIGDEQKVLDDARENVFMENGVKVDELDFDVYAERITDYLNGHEDVEDVFFHRDESVLNSLIVVKFNSGFLQFITFQDEASSLLDGGNGATQSHTQYAGRALWDVSPAAIDPSKPVNARAISYRNADDLNTGWELHERVNNFNQIAHSDYDGPYTEYDDSLNPLRSLNGYNLIIYWRAKKPAVIKQQGQFCSC
ncbi:MAG: hypothetical protein LBJ22_02075 [Synergistaceae bacterium]|jgi:hypothetical protein|nr:hypothetical protein [Synergistaceae bacterium]